MNNILYLLLRTSITASLYDREAFISKVSKIIEQYSHKNPQAAHKLGNQIAGAMEGFDEALFLQQLLKPKHDEQLNQILCRLTDAVEQLNTLLENKETTIKPSNTENL